MAFTISPNMGLTVPVVGNEPGPQYALDVNACMGILDQHNHTAGSGVQIVPAAININALLTFNNNAAGNVSFINLTPQSVTPVTVSSIYSSATGDLFFVDGVGNNVRITQSGGVAGTPGSISNLTSPASASYVAGSQTFVWQSAVNTAANMDFGAAVMRNLSPNSTFSCTLQPPAALASNYTLTLPTIPAALSFMTMDNTGNMAGSIVVAQGLTAANMANKTITATQIADHTITSLQLAVGLGQLQQAIFYSSNTFTTPADSSTSTLYKVTVVGGGGGGGVGNGGAAAGGGSAGGTAIGYVSGLAPSTGVAVVVGSGGAGNSSGTPQNGAAGSASSFNGTIIGNGGNGGNFNGAAGWGSTVAGGTASGGSLNIQGGGGNAGLGYTYASFGGQGGSTPFGQGGYAQAVASGFGGTGYGAGGAGSFGGNASGAGAPGIVIVEWIQ